jgi:kanamycin kinase
MTLTPTTINIEEYPAEIRHVLDGAKLFDSSCSDAAKVIFIDKDGGYFLKIMPSPGFLHGESYMTEYFHGKGLAPRVVAFVPDFGGSEFMLTEKLSGDDCIAQKYLDQPKKLCDTIAERLAFLHSLDCGHCLVRHSDGYIARAKNNYKLGKYDRTLFPDNWGYTSAEATIKVEC